MTEQNGPKKTSATPDNTLPYCSDFLTSDCEQKFLNVLKLCPSLRNLQINLKTRLADVCKCPDEHWKRYGWLVAPRHLDFLVVDPHTSKPILAIELDDSSHDSAEARKRDAFMDSALASAGIPILRIRACSYYDVEELDEQICAKVPSLRDHGNNKQGSNGQAEEKHYAPVKQVLWPRAVMFALVIFVLAFLRFSYQRRVHLDQLKTKTESAEALISQPGMADGLAFEDIRTKVRQLKSR